MRAIVLGLCTAMVLVVRVAEAQMPLPTAKPPDGATLFKQHCAVCHTLSLSEPMRQGPSLVKIVGRPAGKAEGFKYSEALSKADFAWDETRLDAWLTDPQAVVPGVTMVYRQAKPETRAAVIAYLKEQN
ncbi:cytochrome c [Bradyrhizobium sp. LM6.10]|jgi:cytochrome c|uniref:c-type cytochrome n=1 Tax=unclassified Bradyrhizobium TaxID=2631580 RepID=UPI001FFB046A|nr:MULTISPECIES: c-type cytochrome [unclassified Bradyrhizobium]MCK1338930.1 c-type cytochrome [Bradyrhizobium sp. 38]MCK1782307.1 c-type cytochrome [Bradyrhizobium sp. 132]